MKAVAIEKYLPINDERALLDVELPLPKVEGRDLLVEVKAIAVNPVDVKVRAPKDAVENPPRVIGWDASGVIKAVGADVSLFKPGDEVYYAGDITRPGTNAEYQLVDERIVGFKPKTLDFASAAALPLTTITAYESLFDRLGIDKAGGDSGKSLLIIGAAGGVGSIAIQLAKQAGLKVIATASRPASSQWVTNLGADLVVNYQDDLVTAVKNVGHEHVDYVAIFNDMNHWNAAVELVKPQGAIVTIEDTDLPMPMSGMKTKSASLHWEFMFARSMHQTDDMVKLHELLDEVAQMIDSGKIKTTVNQVLTPIDAKKLRQAHAMLEQGNTIGKVVLEAWPS